MAERNERGHFLPGNKVASKKLSKIELQLRREDRKMIIGFVRKYAFMTVDDLKKCTKNPDGLMVIEGILIKHFTESLTRGDLNFLKLILNYLGIVEIRAMAIQEVDKLQNEEDDEIKELNLSKEEKMWMLDKYREIIESE